MIFTEKEVLALCLIITKYDLHFTEILSIMQYLNTFYPPIEGEEEHPLVPILTDINQRLEGDSDILALLYTMSTELLKKDA